MLAFFPAGLQGPRTTPVPELALVKVHTERCRMQEDLSRTRPLCAGVAHTLPLLPRAVRTSSALQQGLLSPGAVLLVVGDLQGIT